MSQPLHLDTSVIVIRKDGEHVLTDVIEPGDELLGGATYDELANRYEVPKESATWPIRTDANQHPQDSTPSVPLPPEEGTVANNNVKPDADAPKKDWWTYAKSVGYNEADYEHSPKAVLEEWVSKNA